MKIIKNNGKHIFEIEFDEEPIFNAREDECFYVVTNLTIDSTPIEKEKMLDGYEYFLLRFEYVKKEDEDVFVLTAKYDTGKKIAKLLNINNNLIHMTMDKDIENLFKEKYIPYAEEKLKKRYKEKHEELIEKDKLITDNQEVVIVENTTYGYYASFTNIEESLILKEINEILKNSKEKIGKLFEDLVVEDISVGDYSITTIYKTDYKTLKNKMEILVQK